MTSNDVAASQQWIDRLRSELDALEHDPRNPQTQSIAEGIREEIARVSRLIGPDSATNTLELQV